MTPASRVNFSFDDKTIRLMKMISEMTGASNSEIVRRGVAAYAKELKDGANRVAMMQAIAKEMEDEEKKPRIVKPKRK